VSVSTFLKIPLRHLRATTYSANNLNARAIVRLLYYEYLCSVVLWGSLCYCEGGSWAFIVLLGHMKFGLCVGQPLC
jgi:hypothetical protein